MVYQQCFLLVIAVWLESRRALVPWKQPSSCTPSWTDLPLMCNSIAVQKHGIGWWKGAACLPFWLWQLERGRHWECFYTWCVCVCGENGNLWSPVELEGIAPKCFDSKSAEVSAWQAKCPLSSPQRGNKVLWSEWKSHHTRVWKLN